MPPSALRRTNSFRIIAQDPGIQGADEQILTVRIDIPAESILPGPRGQRVQLIDFDTSTQQFHAPLCYTVDSDGTIIDPFESMDSSKLVEDWHFHSQNVYAIVMDTLAIFERALGRRANWAGESHQLKLVPHAFRWANAFYDPSSEAVLFGYYTPSESKKTFYTCLSHDVVTHETTHALLDGLRDRFIYPSSPDQAAFHEAYADIVALLSVFSLPETVKPLLRKLIRSDRANSNMIAPEDISPERLKETALFGLADEMGEEDGTGRVEALRRSVKLKPSVTRYENDPDFLAPHVRGEILVAAVMNSFINVWSTRLQSLGAQSKDHLNLDRVVEEGRDIAEYFLLMVIRAIDYTPPVHIIFPDFLSALITSENEIHPDDSRYGIRQELKRTFGSYGIEPVTGAATSRHEDSILGEPDQAATPDQSTEASPPHHMPTPDGSFRRADELNLSYDQIHFDSLVREPNEVFGFIWNNRNALGLDRGIATDAFWKVLSVRPCVRVSVDGFVLRETVAEFYQVMRLTVDELRKYGCDLPSDMPGTLSIPLYGGATVIFDEFGRLKYFIHNSLVKKEQQVKRIRSQWEMGGFSEHGESKLRIAEVHRLRAKNSPALTKEGW